MNDKTLALGIMTLASTVVAGGPVQAQVGTAPHPTILCGGNPNKTLTFDYESPRQQATSGTAYPNGECPNYVVDIVVPSHGGASESSLLIGSGPAVPPTKAACDSYAETYSIRKTGVDGKTTVVASGTRKGTWSSSNTPVTDPHCVISGSVYSFKRPSTGTEKYRVLTRATLNGNVSAVEVSVGFINPPR